MRAWAARLPRSCRPSFRMRAGAHPVTGFHRLGGLKCSGSLLCGACPTCLLPQQPAPVIVRNLCSGRAELHSQTHGMKLQDPKP